MKSARQQNPSAKKRKRRPRSITRRNLKNLLRFLPVIAPLLITAFIYTWQHTRMSIVGAPVEGLRADRTDLIKHNDSIRLRIEQLQAPARIETIAREKLGMVSPEKWQVVTLDHPTQPPEAADETDGGRTGRIFPIIQKAARLLGFPEKQETFGAASQRRLRSGPGSQAG